MGKQLTGCCQCNMSVPCFKQIDRQEHTDAQALWVCYRVHPKIVEALMDFRTSRTSWSTQMTVKNTRTCSAGGMHSPAMTLKTNQLQMMLPTMCGIQSMSISRQSMAGCSGSCFPKPEYGCHPAVGRTDQEQLHGKCPFKMSALQLIQLTVNTLQSGSRSRAVVHATLLYLTQ